MSLEEFYIKLYNKLFTFIEQLPLDQKIIAKNMFCKIKSPEVLDNERRNRKDRKDARKS